MSSTQWRFCLPSSACVSVCHHFRQLCMWGTSHYSPPVELGIITSLASAMVWRGLWWTLPPSHPHHSWTVFLYTYTSTGMRSPLPHLPSCCSLFTSSSPHDTITNHISSLCVVFQSWIRLLWLVKVTSNRLSILSLEYFHLTCPGLPPPLLVTCFHTFLFVPISPSPVLPSYLFSPLMHPSPYSPF